MWSKGENFGLIQRKQEILKILEAESLCKMAVGKLQVHWKEAENMRNFFAILDTTAKISVQKKT